MLLFWNLVDFLLHLPCIYIEEIWRTKLNCTHLIANQLQVDKIMLIFCCLMWNFYTKLNLAWQFHIKQIAGIIFQNWNRFLCYHSTEHKLWFIHRGRSFNTILCCFSVSYSEFTFTVHYAVQNFLYAKFRLNSFTVNMCVISTGLRREVGPYHHVWPTEIT